ncbi:hypothetical protein PILCRDRAFT_446946 [Piloderma croceum F 1598]|uniref:Uncharacterized protein n=1 Tax=Piloderma croceum (strain F 1598) TaxID=765440 RepID=A0A0C3C009_PILCF|nr:hypothetical protein PILCRDRAFT_446946 [Piloderma croceum F 1598]
MPLACQTAGVVRSSFTIRTLEPKLLCGETRHSSIQLAISAPQQCPTIVPPCQPQRRRKSKVFQFSDSGWALPIPVLQGTQSRHAKPLNRASSTPPILDRFSPYRHRSRVDSLPRCQKTPHHTLPLKYDTYMPEAAASNNPTAQNTWTLSPTSSSAHSPTWSQAVTNSIAAVSPSSSDCGSGQPSTQVASRLPDGQTR